MQVSDFVGAVGVGVAALALVWGLYTYSRQAALSRAAHFHDLRKKFFELDEIRAICIALHDDGAD